VINLVTNAMDAMATNPDQSRMLLVKTERVRDDKISMTVTDSGPGISPEQRGRLFDAFVTSKSQGMGLGLAICKMIVERHGGQISVASNVASSGASFRLVLPSGLTAVAGLESESRAESA
jgi:signal transduction histidine kinase